MKNTLLIYPFVLFIGACATVPRHPQFSTIETVVEDRLGAGLYWHNTNEVDPSAKRVVDSLFTTELTVDGAVQIALFNNRGIQATFESLGIAQGDIVQASLLKNPVLNGVVKLGLGGIGTGHEFGVIQEFMSLFQMPRKKRVAASAFEQVRLNVANEVMELAARTREAFYTLQAAEQRRELISDATDAARLGAEMAKRQFDAGNISSVDLAREQALHGTARLQLLEAESEIIEYREKLAVLMGVWDGDLEWRIQKKLPGIPESKPTVQDLEAIAVEQRFDLAALKQEIVRVGEEAGVAKAQTLIPELAVGVAFERSASGEKSVNPSLGVGIPLFDRGQGISATADARIRQAQERFTDLAVKVRSDVRRYAARLDAARERVEQLETVLMPLRARITEETQLLYNGMYVGIYDLLEVKRDEIETERMYVDALEDYWLAHSRLMQSFGGRVSMGGQ